MERQAQRRVFGIWLLIGLGLLAISRGLPRLLSAPFAACLTCDVLGFVLLLASVVLGIRAEVRRRVGETACFSRAR